MQIILAFGTFTKGVTVGGEQESSPHKVIWETVTRGQSHMGECQIVLSLFFYIYSESHGPRGNYWNHLTAVFAELPE